MATPATAQMDPKKPKFESFKNLTAGLQSIVAVVALAITAGWVWHTWRIQRKDHLKNLYPAIEAGISAHATTIDRGTRGKEYWIRGSISLKNAGTQTTTILLDEHDGQGRPHGPIYVARIKSMENGKLQFDDQI